MKNFLTAFFLSLMVSSGAYGNSDGVVYTVTGSNYTTASAFVTASDSVYVSAPACNALLACPALPACLALPHTWKTGRLALYPRPRVALLHLLYEASLYLMRWRECVSRGLERSA